MCPRNMHERWKDWVFSSQLVFFCTRVIPLCCGFLCVVILHEHMSQKWMPRQTRNTSETHVAPFTRTSWERSRSPGKQKVTEAACLNLNCFLQASKLQWFDMAEKLPQRAAKSLASALNLQPAGEMQNWTSKVLRNWEAIVANSPNSLLSAG